MSNRYRIEGLQLTIEDPEHLDAEDWLQIGRELGATAKQNHWAYGDWWNYGVPSIDDRKIGELPDEERQRIRNLRKARIAKVIEAKGLGYAHTTLKTFGQIAATFDRERRRAPLLFEHHRIVRALPRKTQEALLDQCERNGWRRNELRDAVREWRIAAGWEVTNTLPKLNPAPAQPSPPRAITITDAMEKLMDMIHGWALQATSREMGESFAMLLDAKQRNHFPEFRLKDAALTLRNTAQVYLDYADQLWSQELDDDDDETIIDSTAEQVREIH